MELGFKLELVLVEKGVMVFTVFLCRGGGGMGFFFFFFFSQNFLKLIN